MNLRKAVYAALNSVGLSLRLTNWESPGFSRGECQSALATITISGLSSEKGTKL